MPRLLVFDMDGTVLDSMGTLENKAVEVMSQGYGLSDASCRIFYKSTAGRPFREQLEINFPKDERNDEVNRRYEAEHEKLMAENAFRLADDFDHAMSIAVSRSFSVALVSSTDYRFIRQNVSIWRLPWSQLLGFMASSPKKNQIEQAMHQACYRAKDTIYFGDTSFDRDIAGELGIAFVLVTPQSLARAVIHVVNEVVSA